MGQGPCTKTMIGGNYLDPAFKKEFCSSPSTFRSHPAENTLMPLH